MNRLSARGGTAARRSAIIPLLTVVLFVAAGASLVCAQDLPNLDDLDGRLKKLVQAHRQAPVGVRAVARAAGMTMRGNQVLVIVRCRSETAMHQVRAQLPSEGADVYLWHDVRIEAWVPVDKLAAISNWAAVTQIHEPYWLVPAQVGGVGIARSQGVQLTGAISFHANGLFGSNVSVAVIDMEFQNIVGSEFLSPPTVVNLRADGTLGAGEHGSACGEIISDMAPMANLTFFAVSTGLEIIAALDQVRASGYDIVSISIGGLDGPYDGTSPESLAINRARQSGSFVACSAGNQAMKHWSGTPTDNDADRRMEFSGGDEGIGLNLTGGEMVVAYVSWYETSPISGVTDQDYDLVLVDNSDFEIARSGLTQNGDDPPSERLVAFIPPPPGGAGTYTMRLEAYGPQTDPQNQPQKFQIQVDGLDIEQALQVPEESFLRLADATEAVTVAATRGTTDFSQITDPALWPAIMPVDTLEDFSSQGPRVGGAQAPVLLTKPEFAGPDGVITAQAVNGMNPFFGTSAACPHVAGAAALIKGENAARTPDDIEAVLARLAIDIPPPNDPVNPDTQTGHGRVYVRPGVDADAPTITIIFPENASTISTRNPVMRAQITDVGLGVDENTIDFWLDGVQRDWRLPPVPGDPPPGTFDAATGEWQYLHPSTLARTVHTIRLECSDIVGNRSDPAISNFRISLPTIGRGLRLFSLPYTDLANDDPAFILGVPLGSFDLIRWNPEGSGTDKYRSWPDPFASFNPPDAQGVTPTVTRPPIGLAYWLRLPVSVQPSIEGAALTALDPYDVRLRFGSSAPRGWNQLGCPFEASVAWPSVQFLIPGLTRDLDDAIVEGWTEGTLFEYVTGSSGATGFYDFSDPFSSILEPMGGYWIHVLRDVTVRFWPPVTGAGAPASQPRARPVLNADTDWRMQLGVRAGELQDPKNYAGVGSACSAGYDPGRDVLEPPPPFAGVSLYFPHEDWGEHAGRYAQDLRAPGNVVRIPFETECHAPGAEVTVSWPDVNVAAPRDWDVVLEDVDGGQTVAMRTRSGYTYTNPVEGAVRHFVVIATPAEPGQALQFGAISAQQSRGAGIQVSFSLNRGAEVSCEVLNIAGRVVRRQELGLQSGGDAQSAVWNGTSDEGTPVPAGRYLIRLTARTDDFRQTSAVTSAYLGK